MPTTSRSTSRSTGPRPHGTRGVPGPRGPRGLRGLRGPRGLRGLRRAVGALAAVASLCALLAVPAAASTAVPGPRAMWLWQRSDPAATMDWATANAVKEIFVHVPTKITRTELTRLKQLKKRADAAGVRLSALGGEPGWTFDHAAALAWQRAAMGTGLFRTTHVDVEPYHLNEWHTDQAGTTAAFLGLLARLRDADPRPLEADVPFWYETVPAEGSTLADAVLARVDAITVMSYRDTATGPGSIIDVGQDMLLRGQLAGRPVRLAAETLALPDCPYCTFHEQGRQALDTALSAVDAAAVFYPAYAGMAVHDYASWTALRP
ncbi:collagen-like protein [Planomonospora sp. ID82291]|uniref:collagen-like triple helix repeat-containing protein n=1 Tax=Planomonospora sp. ID82291 TaxID=2738136 RepID=UPI0018C44E45|nr:collagen-like protein [Planomonospora sp. ID82291]MBG0818471.1 collagen-like protein [Planomonospora sp. ID82291]